MLISALARYASAYINSGRVFQLIRETSIPIVISFKFNDPSLIFSRVNSDFWVFCSDG